MSQKESEILCDSTLTQFDQAMTLTRLEKILDYSDSKGLWLWLDKNDSDTSLLVACKDQVGRPRACSKNNICMINVFTLTYIKY